jgi:alpha-tubulin suppressor-like RCC1 family protein
MFLTEENHLFAAGNNEFGQLGSKNGQTTETTETTKTTETNGTTETLKKIDSKFFDNEVIKQVSFGEKFSLILTETGNIFASGNIFAQSHETKQT